MKAVLQTPRPYFLCQVHSCPATPSFHCQSYIMMPQILLQLMLQSEGFQNPQIFADDPLNPYDHQLGLHGQPYHVNRCRLKAGRVLGMSSLVLQKMAQDSAKSNI